MDFRVEEIAPCRKKVTVTVPAERVKSEFDAQFGEINEKISLPGFRPGKAPRKLLEARVGRGAVLEQVVNDALPGRYSQAVSETDVKPLGQPDIEITKIEDNEQLEFTAEVDVRPEITLPDLSTLKISVDPVAVADEDVDAELQSLRARFGTLTGVERAVEDGDFVSIDLSATVDGQDVPEAKTEGLSHEVGSGQLIDGLDEALIGMSAGESKTFTTKLVAGPHVGQDAEVSVAVGSVKTRELPEADDDFAQLASEFDTIDELKENLTEQVTRFKSIQQAEKIRDAALEALLEQTEVPLPEKIVQAQVDDTLHNAIHGLDHNEERFEEMLKEQGSSREEFDADSRSNAEKAVKTQLLMDAIADDLDIQVGQADITERLVLMSQQYGIEPQQLIQLLQQNNQLPAMFADVRRGLTVAAVVEAASVTDTDGNVIDTSEFFGRGVDGADAVDEADDEADDDEADAAAE